MITLILLIICIVKRRKNIAAFRLDGEGSIDFSGYIELGGIKQYVSVRGESDRNPILLFLHGGPGAPVSCVSYCYQRPLERSLTVVNWDQRGSGRTYYENADCSRITIDTLVTDLEELIGLLRDKLPGRKIYLLGFSFGTAIALNYLSRHPEGVDAYISVGQCVDMKKGLDVNIERVLSSGKKGARFDDVNMHRLLDRIYACTEGTAIGGIKNYMRLQRLFSGSISLGNEKSIAGYFIMGSVSPFLGARDLRWKLKQCLDTKGYFTVESELMKYLFLEFDAFRLVKDFRIPVCFLSGEGDYTTPVSLVKEYARTVTAPNKRMLTVKRAGHSPMFDRPEAFVAAMNEVIAEFAVMA